MIKVGDKIPQCILKVMGEDGPMEFDTSLAFKDKKVVLFAVPGAFTPTCSASHLPGFVTQYDALTAAGADLVVCLSVNDVFVMNAWGKSANAENICMLADGNAELTSAMGLDKDASKNQMGTRSKRYAMIIDNATLSYITIDELGLDTTSAEAILQHL
ncbi:MAG: peroxiredoxin [Oceanospirillaceae bacterium]|nr:peroxiredoxin [Oceanospirillaceae bacterium]